MAMQYGDALLDRVYGECFKPAVERAGFSLFRLDERPEAGLIDNRMRVDIRASRFLIADITNRNPGAYWEAGFAEGLGKPVIYTCERSRFSEHKHFDVEHHYHVLWDADKLDAAQDELATAIRATLPSEARISDEEPKQ
jgi:nucleoside 2-deoxyribosyltransferase